jgi:hypothetical protein
MAFVAGKNLVPHPAAGITTFRMLIVYLLAGEFSRQPAARDKCHLFAGNCESVTRMANIV